MNVDKDKFWKLLEPVHPAAEAFCRKLADNREAGDDLYQDGLLQAMKNFDSLRDYKAFKPWLYSILINRFKNSRRGFWNRFRTTLAENVFSASKYEDPQRRLDYRRWLRHAMEALSAEDRALILLFELQGLSVVELSEIFNKPSGTIKARLSRSRAKMRKRLERHFPELSLKKTSGEFKHELPGTKTID